MAEWAYCAGTFSSHVVTFAGEEAGRERGGQRTKEEAGQWRRRGGKGTNCGLEMSSGET